MSRIVFARTRWAYDSYRDFWRLVELSGFRVCFLDEADLSADAVYITSPINGEIEPFLKSAGRSRTARLVLWELERPDGGRDGGDVAQLLRQRNDRSLTFFDRIWVSDRWLSRVDPRMHFLVMASHPGLAAWDSERRVPEWDLAHLSYVTGRRQAVLDQLGRTLRIAPNAWHPERDAILRASRAILNVHQTGAPVSEPLRIALAAAYGIPYLTEHTEEPDPLEPGRTCLMAPYAQLTGSVEAWLGRDLEPLGAALSKALTEEDDFGRSVLRAVSASGVGAP